MPTSIARVISAKHATLRELQTHYGSEDLYTLLEIIAVDTYNTNAMNGQD